MSFFNEAFVVLQNIVRRYFSESFSYSSNRCIYVDVKDIEKSQALSTRLS